MVCSCGRLSTVCAEFGRSKQTNQMILPSLFCNLSKSPPPALMITSTKPVSGCMIVNKPQNIQIVNN